MINTNGLWSISHWKIQNVKVVVISDIQTSVETPFLGSMKRRACKNHFLAPGAIESWPTAAWVPQTRSRTFPAPPPTSTSHTSTSIHHILILLLLMGVNLHCLSVGVRGVQGVRGVGGSKVFYSQKPSLMTRWSWPDLTESSLEASGRCFC